MTNPLKSRLATGEIIIAPGVFDGLSARVAGQAGFDALFLTGYGISASLLAQPDAGFLHLSHMEDRIRTIARVTTAPLIADADTGFGGGPQVDATVRAYGAAGASAIQIEDQVFPKRCGHTPGREVVPLEEAVERVATAAKAAKESDILLIARTDARTPHGLDEAIARAEAYRDAGADILFVESPESEEELAAIGACLKGTPLVANMVEGGRTPFLPPAELQAMGFAIVLYPVAALAAAAGALRDAYANVTNSAAAPAVSFDELSRMVGFDEIWERDKATPGHLKVAFSRSND